MRLDLNITAASAVTAQGIGIESMYEAYKKGLPSATFSSELKQLVSCFPMSNEAILSLLTDVPPYVQYADRTALLALLALKNLSLEEIDKTNLMVSMGSSRGATNSIESALNQFANSGKLHPYTSPTTTLGNLASILAQTLQINAIRVEHSMTCSTALQALLNAGAWLMAGMASTVLAGAAESPLTPFTIAQFRALKLYADPESDALFPSRPLDLAHSTNSLFLGEAAILFTLQIGDSKRIGRIISAGYGTESQKHPVSIDIDGYGFRDSMRMALQSAGLEAVDIVICHATGSRAGDKAELNAIDAVFKNKPVLTSTKWLTGHTFGAAGMHSILLGLIMLDRQQFILPPYLNQTQLRPGRIKTIMVNTLGFGGQAMSVVLSH